MGMGSTGMDMGMGMGMAGMVIYTCAVCTFVCLSACICVGR